MKRDTLLTWIILGGAALMGLSLLEKSPLRAPPAPAPDVKPCPGPNCPDPAPKPKPKPRRPWGEFPPSPVGDPGKPVLGGKTSPDGTEEISCDLPMREKKRNVGGTDGAGLCVFTSIEWASRYQNERRLWDFQASMRKERGGGYPTKVDAMIKKYAPGVPYIQHTGGDLGFLRAAIASGRMPCITYGGYDPHYRGYVAHMVCLAHLGPKWAAVTDNNFTGDDQFVWMSIAEFEKRWKSGGGGGWAVVLLAPPPPPPPRG